MPTKASGVGRLASGVLVAVGCAWGEDSLWTPVVDFGHDTVVDLGGYVTAPLHWSGGQWALAGGVGVAIGASIAFEDQHVKEEAQSNRSDRRDRLAGIFNPLGTVASVGVLGIGWGVGEAVGDPRGRQFARDGLEATIIASGIITPLLKATAGRSRPSDVESDHWKFLSHNQSFPSGHTTQAFALASVAARTYDDQPLVGGVAFALAAGVGWARIDGNHHYLGDTLAGAAIGTSVGWFVVGQNRERRAGAVGVQPVAAADRVGVLWTF